MQQKPVSEQIGMTGNDIKKGVNEQEFQCVALPGCCLPAIASRSGEAGGDA